MMLAELVATTGWIDCRSFAENKFKTKKLTSVSLKQISSSNQMGLLKKYSA